MSTPPLPPAAQQSPAQLKRRMLLAILAIAWVSSSSAWIILEMAGKASPVLHLIFALNVVFHPVVFAISWRQWLPQRVVETACLLFASIVCAGCMALRLYTEAGASIQIGPLYIWIPVIYVFVFTLAGHERALKLALSIYALFVFIALPYLLHDIASPQGNFTLQLLLVSAILITALYFFSNYQHRFQIAQLTMDQLARLANTDELTQLANRRRALEAINGELLRSARYGHALSIILFDIDHFKTINDRHGHATGDKVLIALANRTQEMLRDVDTLGRWGGEEFVVVLPETGYAQALSKAHDLCTHVAAQALAGHKITISCGVTSTTAGDDAERLLARADQALYAAKGGGRNRAEGM